LAIPKSAGRGGGERRNECELVFFTHPSMWKGKRGEKKEKREEEEAGPMNHSALRKKRKRGEGEKEGRKEPRKAELSNTTTSMITR